MTEDEARVLIGTYCEFTWIEDGGEPGGMVGWAWKVWARENGDVWVAVDYGYAAATKNVTIRRIEPPADEYWDAEADTSKKRRNA